jgi:hypothetical protein
VAANNKKIITLSAPYLRPNITPAKKIPIFCNTIGTVIIFLLLAATGLPLLSGGRGGIGVFAGPSAGFLLQYLIIKHQIQVYQ